MARLPSHGLPSRWAAVVEEGNQSNCLPGLRGVQINSFDTISPLHKLLLQMHNRNSRYGSRWCAGCSGSQCFMYIIKTPSGSGSAAYRRTSCCFL